MLGDANQSLDLLHPGQLPPLWILPAWSLSTLAIERLTRCLDWAVTRSTPSAGGARGFQAAYWILFTGFYVLLAKFVAPTRDKPLTWLAMIGAGLVIVTPTNPRVATLTFLAGSGLGYSLERWGTTRGCWTYYTGQTPPLVAVLAHGMACVVFWRARRLIWRRNDIDGLQPASMDPSQPGPRVGGPLD